MAGATFRAGLLCLLTCGACAEQAPPPATIAAVAPVEDTRALRLPPLDPALAAAADSTAAFVPGGYLTPASWEDFPIGNDSSLLLAAIESQLAFVAGRDRSEYSFGGGVISKARLLDTLLRLRRTLDDEWGRPAFRARLERDFHIYRSIGRESDGLVLFTGYYLPVIKASPVRSDSFPVPLYARPAVRRRHGYPTHAQIDKGVLAGKGLEVAWVESKLDRFFLMVQGSGLLEYPDGTRRSARYAGGNKRPYTSIGRLLVEDGHIPQAEISMQRIRQFFTKRPDLVDAYLHRCASFVFFRVDDVTPHGIHGLDLKAFHSVATDARIFGTGLVGLADYPLPYAAPESGPAPVRRNVHFVFANDVGGAIRGPDHIDIFTGVGPAAGVPAGFLQHGGRLFFIVSR